VASSLQAFRPKYCTHFLSLPCVLYVMPISNHSITLIIFGEPYKLWSSYNTKFKHTQVQSFPRTCVLWWDTIWVWVSLRQAISETVRSRCILHRPDDVHDPKALFDKWEKSLLRAAFFLRDMSPRNLCQIHIQATSMCMWNLMLFKLK